MSKRSLLIASTILIILIASIFLVKGCQPRIKTESATTSPSDANTTVNQPSTQLNADEVAAMHNNFINANIEMTCEILKNPGLKNDRAQIEKTVYDIFVKHNLPVEDNGKMVTILAQYENDQDVARIVKENSDSCAQGGEATFIQ